MVSRLPVESGESSADGFWFEFAVTAVTPSRSEITLSYCVSVIRGICEVLAIPVEQLMTLVAPTCTEASPPVPLLEPPFPELLEPPLPEVLEPPFPESPDPPEPELLAPPC